MTTDTNQHLDNMKYTCKAYVRICEAFEATENAIYNNSILRHGQNHEDINTACNCLLTAQDHIQAIINRLQASNDNTSHNET